MHKLHSRKFWVSTLSGLLLLGSKWLGLDIPDDAMLGISAIVVGYLASQGWVDGQQIKSRSHERGDEDSLSAARKRVTQKG